MDDLGSQKEEVVKLRATITQQAQELAESERKLREVCMAHGPALFEIHDLKKELEQAKGNYAIQKAAADDYEQQLAASQARCREMENGGGVVSESTVESLTQARKRIRPFECETRLVGEYLFKHDVVTIVSELYSTIAQLQATRAAREVEVDRLKLAQQHSIQDECEAEQRLIDAGISVYEDDGDYRGLLTQIDLCIKQRDAAVQEAGRLKEAALWAMNKVKRLSTRAMDYKRAEEFIEHERALKGA